MNAKLFDFAKKYGVVIAERSSTESYIWDGKTIANHCVLLGCKQYFTDIHLAHEIAHWLVAAPWQRELPEYGMKSLTGYGCLPLQPLLSCRDEIQQERFARRKDIMIYERCRLG
jgi:hypothetical protein